MDNKHFFKVFAISTLAGMAIGAFLLAWTWALLWVSGSI